MEDIPGMESMFEDDDDDDETKKKSIRSMYKKVANKVDRATRTIGKYCNRFSSNGLCCRVDVVEEYGLAQHDDGEFLQAKNWPCQEPIRPPILNRVICVPNHGTLDKNVILEGALEEDEDDLDMFRMDAIEEEVSDCSNEMGQRRSSWKRRSETKRLGLERISLFRLPPRRGYYRPRDWHNTNHDEEEICFGPALGLQALKDALPVMEDGILPRIV